MKKRGKITVTFLWRLGSRILKGEITYIKFSFEIT